MFAVFSLIDEETCERVCLCDSEYRAYEIAHQTSVKDGVPCKVERMRPPFARAKAAWRDRDRNQGTGGAMAAGCA